MYPVHRLQYVMQLKVDGPAFLLHGLFLTMMLTKKKSQSKPVSIIHRTPTGPPVIHGSILFLELFIALNVYEAAVCVTSV